MALAAKRFDKHEDVTRAKAFVFRIVPQRLTGAHRQRLANFAYELFAGFIHANHGKPGMVGPVVDFEDVFHPPDEFPVVLLRKAPLLFQPRLNRIFLRAYPRTEQTLTFCVEQDMDVMCSSHGGGYAMQLVWPVCADAGENVATVGAVVAQVSAESEGWAASRKSAGGGERNLLSVAYGLPVEGVAAAVRRAQHGASVLPGMEPAPDISSLLEEMPANV